MKMFVHIHIPKEHNPQVHLRNFEFFFFLVSKQILLENVKTVHGAVLKSLKPYKQKN